MTTPQITMFPYRREGDIDYAGLDFDPDDPEKPDAMQQHPEQREIVNLLSARFAEFDTRPDVFIDYDSFICYDRTDLNVRVSPDVYLVFGVDAAAIRPRRLYLPWEAGKPPDWALEIGSLSTGREDVGRKPGIYARIGVAEYWRFDPSGALSRRASVRWTSVRRSIPARGVDHRARRYPQRVQPGAGPEPELGRRVAQVL